MVRGGVAYSLLRDPLGSVVALVDNNGATVASITYDAFGRPRSSGGIASRFTFTGREYDARSGLYYYRARDYDPAIGRFLGEDPVRHTNAYRYADNDRVDLTDPSGTNTEEYTELTQKRGITVLGRWPGNKDLAITPGGKYMNIPMDI